MTVESRIPINELKTYCLCYSRWYRTTVNMTNTYHYKKSTAQRTLGSILMFLFKVFAGIMIIVLNSVLDLGGLISLLGLFILLSTVVDLFYLQKDPRSNFLMFKGRRLRFRLPYFIICFVKDYRDFKIFKEVYGIEKSAFSLIASFNNREAYRQISRQACEICIEELLYIQLYKDKYSDYREFVDLDNDWGQSVELYEILSSGRAVDIQKAYAVVDKRRHMERMEAEQQRHYQEMERIRREEAQSVIDANKAIESAAYAERDAADADRAASESRKALYDALRNRYC